MHLKLSSGHWQSFCLGVGISILWTLPVKLVEGESHRRSRQSTNNYLSQYWHRSMLLGHKVLIRLVLRLKLSRKTKSMPLLLVYRFIALPGHQMQRYWPCIDCPLPLHCKFNRPVRSMLRNANMFLCFLKRSYVKGQENWFIFIAYYTVWQI